MGKFLYLLDVWLYHGQVPIITKGQDPLHDPLLSEIVTVWSDLPRQSREAVATLIRQLSKNGQDQ